MDAGRAAAWVGAGVARKEETKEFTASTSTIPSTSTAVALLPKTAWPPGAPGAGTEPDENATLPPPTLADPLTALEVAVVLAPPLTDWLPWRRAEQPATATQHSTMTTEDFMK